MPERQIVYWVPLTKKSRLTDVLESRTNETFLSSQTYHRFIHFVQISIPKGDEVQIADLIPERVDWSLEFQARNPWIGPSMVPHYSNVGHPLSQPQPLTFSPTSTGITLSKKYPVIYRTRMSVMKHKRDLVLQMIVWSSLNWRTQDLGKTKEHWAKTIIMLILQLIKSAAYWQR